MKEFSANIVKISWIYYPVWTEKIQMWRNRLELDLDEVQMKRYSN